MQEARQQDLERKLRDSETSVRKLLQISSDAVLLQRNGRIVYVNKPALALLGHNSAAQIVGTSVLDVFCERDRPSAKEYLRILNETESVAPTSLTLLRTDGSTRNCVVAGIPLSFEGGPAVGLIVQDTTQTARMEQRLAQTDRLASLGALAGGIGHEVNNPLAYMTANLTFIAEELEELLPATASETHEDLHSALQDVRDGTDRVRDIIRQLSHFARIDSERIEVFDPAIAMETALRMSWNHLRRCATVETQMPFVGTIRGNQARLGQVFLALLLNAANAVKEQPAKDNTIAVACRQEGNSIVIEVSDTGSGIPDQLELEIFEPFFGGGHEGTGLGLPVARHILNSMGGGIQVVPVHAGACLRIHLPIEETRPRHVAAPKRVLVVTDEIRTMEAAQTALRGHTVQFAGRMSMVRFDTKHSDLDTILCDLSNADEVITNFAREAKRHCTSLFFVAQVGTRVTSEEVELADIFLRKPVGADGLAMHLADAWSC